MYVQLLRDCKKKRNILAIPFLNQSSDENKHKFITFCNPSKNLIKKGKAKQQRELSILEIKLPWGGYNKQGN